MSSYKLRVLLTSDSYPPLIGGATRATQQLARHLADRGHAVDVATVWQRGAAATEMDGDVRVHRLRSAVSRVERLSADPTRYTPPPFPDPELVWRLNRLFARSHYDVVHAYGWLSYSVVIAARRHQTPFVLATRDYGNICALRTLVQEGAGRAASPVCDGPATAKCLKCSATHYGTAKGVVAAAGVLSGRRFLRAHLAGLHSCSSYAASIIDKDLRPSAAVPHVIAGDFRDPEELPNPDASVLEQLPDQPYVLFVGALRKIKGIQLLIEAYRTLRDPAPLVMIGTPSPEPIPELPPGVALVTNVNHATVMAAWDNALFGVFPSVLAEPLGNVLHEAMSRGVPVIGTKPGGHSDIVADGESGLLVPSGDVVALASAMQRLLTDDALRRRLGARARQSAEAFTAAVMVPRLESLLYAAAQRGPGSMPHR
jgi:glycosyltransferase involved in cell wall biosynthesis